MYYEKDTCDGSITLYMALTLVFLLSFFFSILEAARFVELDNQVEQNAMISMYSLFGQYNSFLWENYNLLLLNGAWQNEEFEIIKTEEKMYQESDENIQYPKQEIYTQKSVDLFRYAIKNVEVNNYLLAADMDGNALREQICSFIKKDAVVKEVSEYIGYKKEAEFFDDERNENEIRKSQSEQALLQAEEAQKENDTGLIENTPSDLPENPIKYVDELKKKPLLYLVLPESFTVSGKKLQYIDLCERRNLRMGNWEEVIEEHSLDNIWFQIYLNNFFKNASNSELEKKFGHALDYEIEYMIAGKESDYDNLNEAVKQLLILRESGNFLTIMNDAQKKGTALAIASAAVGFTGLAPLIKVVQIGILLAWAFIESILDVKDLLSGGKIPCIKTSAQWKSDINNLAGSVEKSTKTEDNEKGLSYSDYLNLLLFVKKASTINYRCMDIMEQNAYLNNEGKRIFMDQMILAINACFYYEADDLFWNFILMDKGDIQGYSFVKETSFSYNN